MPIMNQLDSLLDCAKLLTLSLEYIQALEEIEDIISSSSESEENEKLPSKIKTSQTREVEFNEATIKNAARQESPIEYADENMHAFDYEDQTDNHFGGDPEDDSIEDDVIEDVLKDEEEFMEENVNDEEAQSSKDTDYTSGFVLKKEVSNSEEFSDYTRMCVNDFNKLLLMVKPHMDNDIIDKSISVKMRLGMTLMHLSKGTSLNDLARMFKIGNSTARSITLQTCIILYDVLRAEYFAEPTGLDELSSIEREFKALCKLSNCIGAIDGRHMCLDSNDRNGDTVTLIAACNTNYRFTYIDVGCYGKKNDGGVFQTSTLGKRILTERFPAPPAESGILLPYYFAGSSCCPLSYHVMRQYTEDELISEERILFNESLAKALNIIENAFGLLIARWQILQTTLPTLPKENKIMILACTSLHNFLLSTEESRAVYCPTGYVDHQSSEGADADGSTFRIQKNGLWRAVMNGHTSSMRHSTRTRNHYNGKFSIQVRDEYCKLLNS